MRDTKYLSKIFKLKEYVVEKVEEYTHETHIHCHSKAKGMWFVSEYSNRKTETRMRRIPHMMLENQRIVLIITQRRFRFKNTKRWEKLPNVQQGKQTSDIFCLHTLRELQRDNYSGSGHKRQMSGMFPMKLLDNLKMSFEWGEGITRVGLDGKCVKKGKLVHHLVDLDKGKSICILPSLSHEQLKKTSKNPQGKTFESYRSLRRHG